MHLFGTKEEVYMFNLIIENQYSKVEVLVENHVLFSGYSSVILIRHNEISLHYDCYSLTAGSFILIGSMLFICLLFPHLMMPFGLQNLLPLISCSRLSSEKFSYHKNYPSVEGKCTA